ncbi:hypothetical protein [Streptomyces sp. 35G-GA-8]|uniref:hypothetical protein n=1 Tax=Streptomyces sp. 35G-GA-8 TaxID=2939434 RepID=UPI00201EDAB8|nr:hypothetical protein [Streptomyces sp. 35G-GA-8]MCL7382306.1 hypothetical protein [Streptomyces sp. 35G-GA-8]
MSAKLLLENMRDFQQDVLDSALTAVPERFRTVDLASDPLEPTDLGAFTLGKHQHSFRLRFFRLPAPMDREMAWCCWRLVELGGRVPVGSLHSLINSLAGAMEDHPELLGSLMRRTPREWERSLAAAYARHYGRLPGKGWSLNTGTVLRRYYQMLWAAYDQRLWWQREVWDPVLDQDPAAGPRTVGRPQPVLPVPPASVAAARLPVVPQGLPRDRGPDLDNRPVSAVRDPGLRRLDHRPAPRPSHLAARCPRGEGVHAGLPQPCPQPCPRPDGQVRA